MENLLIEAVRMVNPVQLALIALIGFYYYNRLDAKMSENKKSLDKRVDELQQETKAINSRIDKLYDLILDLYKTLSKRDVA